MTTKINSKEKGSAFERKQAAQFSAWLTAGGNKRALWRTPGSGAMAHCLPRVEQAALVGGDLGVLDPKEELAVRFVQCIHTELKHYLQLDWSGWIVYNRGFVKQIWYKACLEAVATRRVPLLVLKANFFPEAVVLPVELSNTLTTFARAQIGKVAAVGVLTNLLAYDPGVFVQCAENYRARSYANNPLPPFTFES